MLIKAQKEITKISDNEKVNSQNYIDSLEYVSILYIFVNKIKNVVSTNDITFLPSFYGRNASEMLHEDHYGKESEMKYLRLSSPLFLVDKTAKKVKKTMESLCESIDQQGDVMEFILK